MEVRREIRWARICDSEGGKALIRNYDIIHNNEILINITEVFPFEVYEDICGGKDEKND